MVLQCLDDMLPCHFRQVQDSHIDLLNDRMLLGAVRGKELLQIGFVDAVSRLYEKSAWHRIVGRTVENTAQRQR